jgi:DNA-binding NtrC family response regulator
MEGEHMLTQRIQSQSSAPKTAFLVPLNHTEAAPIEIGEFLTIGRDTTNLIEISDPFVSGRHARIEKKEQGFLLRDLRSRNGTFLNGNLVSEVYLNPGDRIRLGEREYLFQDQLPQHNQNPFLMSKNLSWSQQLENLPLFSRTSLPVLLNGSSGSGKEVIARLIHECSVRSQGPFVSVNCSALSESLVESELFGHIKGSFTGATHDRRGAFETARGGTLFLDEIGDLPLTLQPKLLRALENREIRPVGSDRTISTDVRIIAATHKDLNARIRTGEFRSDLFFRLHVIKVRIPDLKDRMEDFEDILVGFSREMKVAFSFDTIQELKKHTWPGNIRELKNIVARASAFYPSTRILPEHLVQLLDAPTPMPYTLPSDKLPVVKEFERELIRQRLLINKGNQRKTALDLNMPKSTLHDRIKTYGIEIEKLLDGVE